MTTESTPDPVDVSAGNALRVWRKARGYSQTQLGDALGISFQQVQKYERGANRISLSTAHRACKFLGIDIPRLFEGAEALEDAASDDAEFARRAFVASGPGFRAVQAMADLPEHLWTPAAQAALAVAQAMHQASGKA
jgi:transcriptional regulator with XRE-family HTH domain